MSAPVLDEHIVTTITFSPLTTTVTMSALTTTVDLLKDLDGWQALLDENGSPILDEDGWAIYVK